MRRLRMPLMVVGLLAVLWLSAWVVLPRWALPRLEAAVQEATGRAFHVQAIDVSPSLMHWVFKGVTLDGVGGAMPQFELAALDITLDWRSLWHRAAVVQRLVIERPHLRLRRLAEGRTDLDDVVTRLASKPSDPGDAPVRFALYNAEVRDGAATLVDDIVKGQHELRALRLSVPFLSSLPADVKVRVEPRLAFTLDGAGFDTGAASAPFDAGRQTEARLAVTNLDLEPWLAYLPSGLPVRPIGGRLAAEVTLAFSQSASGEPRLSVAGRAALSGFRAVSPGSRPAVEWKQLSVRWSYLQPLARRLAIAQLDLDGLRLRLERHADGRLEWPVAERAAPSATPGPGAPPWQVSWQRVAVSGAEVEWTDHTLGPKPRWALQDLSVEIGLGQWPGEAETPFAIAAGLRTDGRHVGQVSIKGQGAADHATARVQLADMSLAAAAPVLDSLLAAQAEGTLSLLGQVNWAASGPLTVAVEEARLRRLKMVPDRAVGGDPIAVQAIELDQAVADLGARQLRVKRLLVRSPELTLVRLADGRLNLQQWLRPAPHRDARSPARQSPAGSLPAGEAKPWAVQVESAAVEGASVGVLDTAPEPSVRLRLAPLSARLTALRWPMAGAAPAGAELHFTLHDGSLAGRPEVAGELHWKGRVHAQPADASGRLELRQLPLGWMRAYLLAGLPFALADARLRWQGDVGARDGPAGLSLQARGDAAVTDLRLTGTDGDDLLNWQALSLQAVGLRLQPGAAASLDVGEVLLSDFYARLAVAENGRLNFQAPQDVPAPAAATPAPDPASGAASVPAVVQAAAPAPEAQAGARISVGRTRVLHGRVDFSDRFIKPHYSATLTELAGALGAFSTERPELAALELRGRIAGTARLEITGRLHPLTHPPSLDLHARATDLELAPLSPYSGKYAGYAIERGKLSMDVRYRIDPDGKLEAGNELVLNQLTFGERVDSPDATKLPVLLAVALLKDRHGVIDINLPISGSLNDPKVSVGGIVVKVILNLLAKALTAPFALLSGGGGDDLSLAEFRPGSTELTDAGRAVIDKVARALQDRPALQMTVTGAADPVSEREDMQSMALQRRLDAEHRRQRLRAGARADEALPALTPAERDALLTQLYRDSGLPNRPRNAIGLLKDLPPQQMESLLKAAVTVSTDTARELALQRGLAVRDALAARGLPPSRLFLAAPRLRASGEGDAAWTPRVQLSLSIP